MGKKCIVCKNSWNKYSNRSFHRFPKEIYRKQTWLEQLSLDEVVFSRIKLALVCSDHFFKEDIVCNISGRHILKFNALPRSVSTEAINVVELENISDSTKTAPESLEHSSPNKENILISNSSSVSATKRTSFDLPVLTSSFEQSSQSPLKHFFNADNTQDNIGENDKRLSEIKSSSATVTASSSKLPPPKRKKLSTPRFIGDCNTSDYSSPKTKTTVRFDKKKLFKQRRKIVNLQRQNRRLNQKVNSLKPLLSDLKNKQYISSSAESVIEGTIPGSMNEVMKRILKGQSHEKYSPLLKTFAVTLNFYSSKAYNFVRNNFNNSLPHPRTIRKWYSNIQGKPGCTKEAKAINAKVDP